MPTIVVAAENLVKRYGRGEGAIDALRDVSFNVAEGQFVSITGPSGCGKSTLLNLLAGLDTPGSGRVVVLGHDLSQLSPDSRSDVRLRRIGFVFQSFNLLPTFTAIENVTVPLEFLGLGWSEAQQRAAEVLATVRVSERAYRRLPSELSGGEQQRTAIARALVTSPQILLADEPTGNLDSATGRAILDLLAELNETQNLTVIMVSHSTFAATYGHRTIEMADGRIVRDIQLPTRPSLHLVSDADSS